MTDRGRPGTLQNEDGTGKTPAPIGFPNHQPDSTMSSSDANTSPTAARPKPEKDPAGRRVVTVEVYHVEQEAPRGTAFFEHPERWETRRKHYRHVATAYVHGPANRTAQQILDDAWVKLQKGVGETTATVSVDCHAKQRRSTSVGDVMILDAGDLDADALGRDGSIPFEVGTVGFRDITDDNPEPSIGNQNLLPIGEMESDGH